MISLTHTGVNYLKTLKKYKVPPHIDAAIVEMLTLSLWEHYGRKGLRNFNKPVRGHVYPNTEIVRRLKTLYSGPDLKYHIVNIARVMGLKTRNAIQINTVNVDGTPTIRNIKLYLIDKKMVNVAVDGGFLEGFKAYASEKVRDNPDMVDANLLKEDTIKKLNYYRKANKLAIIELDYCNKYQKDWDLSLIHI